MQKFIKSKFWRKKIYFHFKPWKESLCTDCIANTGNYKNIDPVLFNQMEPSVLITFSFLKNLVFRFCWHLGCWLLCCWDISRLWSDLAHQKKTKGPPIISIISSNSFFLCLFYPKHQNFPALEIPLTSRLYFNSQGTWIAWNIDRGEEGELYRKMNWETKGNSLDSLSLSLSLSLSGNQ